MNNELFNIDFHYAELLELLSLHDQTMFTLWEKFKESSCVKTKTQMFSKKKKKRNKPGTLLHITKK